MIKSIIVLKKIDNLIRIRGTGNPRELAKRLGISERGLYNYINLLKELDAPIAFDRGRNSYFYAEDGFFEINFRRV